MLKNHRKVLKGVLTSTLILAMLMTALLTTYLPNVSAAPNFYRPSAAKILQDLQATNPNYQHPRLMLTPAKLTQLKTDCKNTEPYKTWYTGIKNSAIDIVNNQPLLTEGASVSPDKMLNSAFKLSLAYLVETSNRDRFKTRLYNEIVNVAGFSDWEENESFLSTTDYIMAFAIAYDWLYSSWTSTEKTTIRTALVNKGLQKGRDQLDQSANGTLPDGVFDWPSCSHNWNMICNSGIGIGALAIADESAYSSLCSGLLRDGFLSYENFIVHFAPDGGYFEGPAYWRFLNQTMVPYFSSLMTALGTHYGYLDLEGINRTGYFGIAMMTKTGWNNTQDSGYGITSMPGLFFYGSYFSDPKLSAYRYKQIGLGLSDTAAEVLDVLWYTPPPSGTYDSIFNTLDLDYYFENSQDAIFRNNFFGSDSNYVGINGGKGNVNHGHLDAGSFVYEAAGVRWVYDLGKDNYDLSKNFSYGDATQSRWSYYRYRAEGHNTLVINPTALADQNISATIPVTVNAINQTNVKAVVDLTDAYASSVNSATRTMNFNKDTGKLVLTDKISFKTASGNTLYWFMHTKAAINIAPDGKSAILTQGDKALRVTVLDNKHTLSSAPATPLATSPNPNTWPANISKGLTQNANADYNKLVISATNAGGSNYLLRVSMKPVVDQLTVNDAANASDWSVQPGIQAGDTQYGDRAQTLASVPASLAGSPWIRTANDSKTYTSNPLVSFKVTEDTEVYVAHNDLITTKPSWLTSGGWTDTGEDIVNSDGTVYSAYKNTFTAGSTVSLGSNGNTSSSLYMIVLKPVSVAIGPTDDNFTKGGSDATVVQGSGGTATFLMIKDDPNSSELYDRKAYIKFNIGQMESVEKAVLRVYGYNNTDATPVTIRAYGTGGSNDWTESTITWANAPAVSGSVLSTAAVTDTRQYYEFDVSPYVRSRSVDSKALLTIVLCDEDVANKTVTFNSKEYTAKPPELVIIR